LFATAADQQSLVAFAFNALMGQVGQDGPQQPHGCQGVDQEEVNERLVGHLAHRTERDDTGGDNQAVKADVFRDGRGCGPHGRLGLAQVSGHQRPIEVERLQSPDIAAQEGELRTLLGQAAADRGAEPTSCTGHQHREAAHRCDGQIVPAPALVSIRKTGSAFQMTPRKLGATMTSATTATMGLDRAGGVH